jgi:predicted nuclease of predicted toxin-antitoxin system
MRFLLDLSVHRQVLPFLQELGHDVKTVGIDLDARTPDQEILALAAREGRVVVTADRDFGELVFHRRQEHAGVILLRLGPASIDLILKRMTLVFQGLTEPIEDFLVVSERSVRRRRSS